MHTRCRTFSKSDRHCVCELPRCYYSLIKCGTYIIRRRALLTLLSRGSIVHISEDSHWWHDNRDKRQGLFMLIVIIEIVIILITQWADKRDMARYTPFSRGDRGKVMKVKRIKQLMSMKLKFIKNVYVLKVIHNTMSATNRFLLSFSLNNCNCARVYIYSALSFLPCHVINTI